MPKKTLGFLLIIGGLLSTLTACSSSSVSDEDVNYPLTAIYSATEKAMSMGIDHYSPNHREIYSRPFMVKQDPEVAKTGLRDRGVAKVVILGESKPYTIEVEVSIERSEVKKPQNELTDRDYSYDHHDKRLAIKLLTSITSILDKRQKGNNFIDDFRSF